MSFMNLIWNDLCHPDKINLTSGPMLFCTECRKSLKIYEYVTKPSDDHFRSSVLAEAYFAWTGDENVPMNFILVDLQGIYPKTIFGQSLRRVRKSLRLLKALNAPFLSSRQPIDCKSETDSFLIDFLNIINEHPNSDSTHARMMLDALIKAMHDLLSCKDVINPFETYFEELVPYVQKCFTDWEPLEVNDSFPNLASELLAHLQISSAVRQVFGKFAIPFDVIHVMVGAYTCSVDMDAVGNWVLDFMARVCRGQYFWKNYPHCSFVEKLNRLIRIEIAPTKHAKFCETLRPIRKGESCEYYSTILIPLNEVQQFLRRKFKTNDDKSTEMAFNQLFPTVCFQDHADHLGFTMGYNYLIQNINSNHGKITKGIYKTAKFIHLSVAKYIRKIQQFENASQDPILWTMDTFKLFLASDPDYEKEISETIKTLLDNNQDGTKL